MLKYAMFKHVSLKDPTAFHLFLLLLKFAFAMSVA